MGEQNWIGGDPQEKLWTSWHEAAHILTVYACGGEVVEVTLRDQEGRLTLSTNWEVPDGHLDRVVCAAGAAVDENFGHFFTSDVEQIRAHYAHDRQVLAGRLDDLNVRLGEERNPRLEFLVGREEARAIFDVPLLDKLLVVIRDAIRAEFETGSPVVDAKRLESRIVNDLEDEPLLNRLKRAAPGERLRAYVSNALKNVTWKHE